MKLPEMVQCVAEADETGAYCFQVSGLQQERFEEMIDLFASFGRRVVSDGFSGEPPPDSIDRTMGDLQDCPPGGLDGDLPSRFGDCRIETTNRRLAALAGDSNDEPIESKDMKKAKRTLYWGIVFQSKCFIYLYFLASVRKMSECFS